MVSGLSEYHICSSSITNVILARLSLFIKPYLLHVIPHLHALGYNKYNNKFVIGTLNSRPVYQHKPFYLHATSYYLHARIELLIVAHYLWFVWSLGCPIRGLKCLLWWLVIKWALCLMESFNFRGLARSLTARGIACCGPLIIQNCPALSTVYCTVLSRNIL